MADFLTQLGTIIGTFMFMQTFFGKVFPSQLWYYIETNIYKFGSIFYPYIHLTFNEYMNDGYTNCKAYNAIQTYLGAKSCKLAERLKAHAVKGSRSLNFSIDDCQELTDEYAGIKMWWVSNKNPPAAQTINLYPWQDEKRYYQLTFHKKHRDIVLNQYLRHVIDEGKAIAKKSKQQKLYTNIAQDDRWSTGGNKNMWSCVVFEHPSTFETLAMDPVKKQEIIDDLTTFRNSKDYYAKVGKAWKRGYLLYGPPGTGKSTMIAAMANFLQYDVYDLELTAVKNNTQLRKLLIETSKRSLIVIEDIDCSLDLTGKRKTKSEEEEEEANTEDPNKELKEMVADKTSNDDKSKRVTLSGLLNFIDGLWSACGGERVIIFTTNHVDKLDPALIRRGRMDKHIELSYCSFGAFKVLAKNYLEMESHELFPKIEKLLQECEMTPADVAEYLMPKSSGEDRELTCLKNLISACESKISSSKKEDSGQIVDLI